MSGFLNFSKLKAGQQVLGVVKTVNDFDLSISLCNQLTGFVNCDRISDNFCATLASVANGEANINDIPTLNSYYQTGDIVVAVISSVESPRTGAQRRRLELSLRPQDINKNLSVEHFVSGMVVSGEVTSHEDRGYTISFGLGNGELFGFLPDNEVTSPLKIGKTITCMVAASFTNKSARVITLTCLQKQLAGTSLKGKVDLNCLRCGSLVESEVIGIEKTYLRVSFAGHEGRIDILNLPERSLLKKMKEVELAAMFPIGDRIPARITFADQGEKHFLLSAIDGLVSWNPKLACERVGDKIDGASILRIDHGLGVVLGLDQDNQFAYVHISRLSDERIEKIENAYKVGSKHAARIIDFDNFSGLYQASLQASVLKETILRIQDIHAGQIVRGEVTKIESFGLIVLLNDRIRGICPTFHTSELATETTLKAYHVGQKYKFRVIDVDPKTRRITLSRKRGLLETPLPILSNFNQISVGNQHDGCIVAIKNFGCIVRFFGDVKGIVTVAEMTDDYVDRPQDSFFVGQVVRCKVLKCDPSAKELTLTLRKSSGPKIRTDLPKRSHGENNNANNSKKFKSESKKSLDDLVTATS